MVIPTHFSNTYDANLHATSAFCVGSIFTIATAIADRFFGPILGVRRRASVFVIVRAGALIYPNKFVGYLGGAVEVKSRTNIKYISRLPMAMLHI